MKLLCHVSVVSLYFPNLVTASVPPGALLTLSVSWVVYGQRQNLTVRLKRASSPSYSW